MEGRNEYSFSGQVSYIIRAAAEGEFIAEAALARNLATGGYALSERMTLTVSDHKINIH